jgi:transcriptional regulator with XRE-family HTH domain
MLRALRKAAGVSQEGWAARLGYGRRTIQHWEHGDLPPDTDATQALIAVCEDLRLFRTYRDGALAGVSLSPEWAPQGHRRCAFGAPRPCRRPR